MPKVRALAEVIVETEAQHHLTPKLAVFLFLLHECSRAMHGVAHLMWPPG